MRGLKSILIIIGVLLFGFKLFSQDPVLSQFYNLPSNLNPAFAGNHDAATYAINYRNQWALIQNAYSTYSASYDQYFRSLNGGVGVLIMADNAGDGSIKTTRASLFYSYKLRVNSEYQLKFGIETGFIQARLNWDKLVFNDNLDPQFGKISPGGVTYPSLERRPTNLSSQNIDISTGILLFSSKYYVGISIKHLNNPSLDFYLNNNENDLVGIPVRWTIHGGSQIRLRKAHKNYEGSFISPNFMLTKQGDFLQFSGGVYGQFNRFITGVGIRYAYKNIDAAILSFGWKMHIYKFVYSYDCPLSNIGLSSGGAHEFGILINLNKIYPDRSRYIDCFEMLR